MTLREALLSKKWFKRKNWNKWYKKLDTYLNEIYFVGRDKRFLTIQDIYADDYEVRKGE